MIINIDLFPVATINMVSISIECKRARKEASSLQPIQRIKQVWRSKSMVVKEHFGNLIHDYARKNNKQVWKPKFKVRIKHGGQFELPRQNIF